VHRSLRRLGTDVIDIVLVHSAGDDLRIIQELGTLQALEQLQQEGLIRAFGMSTKTVEGGLAAAALCDVVMLTYNLNAQEELPVLDACADLGVGVLLKKVLASGHLARQFQDPVQASMDLVFAHPATNAAIVGTITPAHLQANVEAVRRALG
jgi:aryl-alcohol dehydrogenase-like predicted oxidoreductase